MSSSSQQTAALVARIRRISSSGTRIEVETMKVWPDQNPKARPVSEFFVNERNDLLVREAETFRNDYRNDYRNNERRIVFHSLKKPLSWAKEPAATTSTFVDPTGEVETQKFCGFVLVIIVFACGVISTIVISRQNRQTR